jgi:hypothetical protein
VFRYGIGDRPELRFGYNFETGSMIAGRTTGVTLLPLYPMDKHALYWRRPILAQPSFPELSSVGTIPERKT